MFLSIIVPAFNVEKYIHKCLSSLLNQTSDDYEIIVINDGSTDKTDQIIEETYQCKIKYINKGKNTGLSDTRNIGTESANGDYIIFVDADDYVENDCVYQCKEIVKHNPRADVIYVGHYKEKNNERLKNKGFSSATDRLWESDKFMISELRKRHFPIPACFAIYRKEFLLENNLKFTTGILHEDELWSIEVALKSKWIATSSKCYYHYVIREGSITHKKDLTQNGLDIIFICNRMIQMLNGIENSSLKKLFSNHIAMLYMKGMCRGALYRKEYRNRFNRWIPIRLSYFLKDRLKASLFAISPYLYYKIDLKYGTKL